MSLFGSVKILTCGWLASTFPAKLRIARGADRLLVNLHLIGMFRHKLFGGLRQSTESLASTWNLRGSQCQTGAA